MSKRRINKQQTARMTRQAQTRRTLHDSGMVSTLKKGLVLARFAKQAEIEDESGDIFHCSIKPQLNMLVCGDNVLFEPEGKKQGLISSIYPRTSVLYRTQFRDKKPVAANITQLVITVAVKPDISWVLLDSYLIIAESLNLHALIVLNKTDLPCEDIQHHLTKYYQPLGYDILYTQQKSTASYEMLQTALDNEVSIFVGQSGTGKSSLISALLPHEENIAIGAIAEIAQLGKHTTSNSRYYHLPEGGALIDSPGVRAFSLGDMPSADVAQGYREFRSWIKHCRFRNCTHEDTPGCAVIQAVLEGHISRLRYDNFLLLKHQQL